MILDTLSPKSKRAEIALLDAAAQMYLNFDVQNLIFFKAFDKWLLIYLVRFFSVCIIIII